MEDKKDFLVDKKEVKDEERQIRIFKNKFKEKPTQADYRALFTIEGKKYIGMLYIRESKDKVEYFGGKIYDAE